MKFLILIILSAQLSFAQDPNCDENGNPIIDLASKLSLPNCATPEKLGAAKKNDISPICDECKGQFEKLSDTPIGSLQIDKKAKFLELAVNEYKKNIINNLVESLKLRALQPTGTSFSKSIASCKKRSFAELTAKCSSNTKAYLNNIGFLKDFDKEIQNELAKVISTDEGFAPEPTLLKRSQRACFIPEKDLLYIASTAAEEALTPSIINAVLSLDPNKFQDVNQMFFNEKVSDEYAGDDVSELLESLKTHPLLSNHFQTPASMVKFLKSISDPKNLDSLRKSIYSKTSGDQFDKRLADSCDSSFSALSDSLCSDDFEKGNINLNPFPNYSKLFNKELVGSSDEYSTNKATEELNLELLKLCDPTPSQKKLSLFEASNNITPNLSQKFKDLSLDQYKFDKHKSDFNEFNTNLCRRKDTNCSDDSFSCRILQKYKEINKPGTLDHKLANSSNKEVNELLRSMIGDTSRIDPKTKEILIAQGIIPKDDGTMIAQPDIPERKPEFFAQESKTNTQQAKLPQTPGNPNSALASNSRKPASEREDPSNSGNKTEYSNSKSDYPDFSDLMGDQFDELKDVQDEIRRRLGALPEKRPATEAEAKKIVNDAFRAKGKKPTPYQQGAFAERMLEPQTQSQTVAASASDNLRQPDSENRASVSNTETQLEKWKAGQKDAALMGMAGAQKVSAKDILSANNQGDKPKELTKVALNIAEDPRVTLSDIFKDKIDRNDPETQLLKVLMRNKNNFLLQIKSMNFKVIFDEQKKNFNVLLESGDRKEAERIRPQLEMFLKKLKA